MLRYIGDPEPKLSDGYVFEDEPYVKYIYYAHDGVKKIEYILTEEAIKININKSELKNPLREIDTYII
ncbi:hypothetical protein [Bacillus sp. H1a]|uniref:hypothetical protein n=1 Tax=Bacillus sp. H1a TaxID=1397276 RepID=UPI00046A6B35|nr:hypothetical protein [Bacillus sp. H1a]